MCRYAIWQTYYLLHDLLHDALVLEVVQKARGGCVGQHTQLLHVAQLSGGRRDAHHEEEHAMAPGVGHGGKDVRVPWVELAVGEQEGHPDRAGKGLALVQVGEVGDGVGGVGPLADVGEVPDAGFEVGHALPLLEGLLRLGAAAVLQEGGPEVQAPLSLEPDPPQAVHHIDDKLLLLRVVVLGTLRAVHQKRQLQTAVLCHPILAGRRERG